METLQHIHKKSLKYALEPFRSIKEKIESLGFHEDDECKVFNERFFVHIVELEESVKEMFARIQIAIDDVSPNKDSMEEYNKCLEYLEKLKSARERITIKDYVTVIENIYENITGALLLWNKLSVNKILQCLSKVQQNLKLFLNGKNEEELLNSFQINVNCLISFMKIMNFYLLDLQLDQIKHELMVSLCLIYKWFVILTKVMKLCMRKSCDNLVEKGRNFIVKHIEEILNKISCVIKEESSQKHLEISKQPGNFVHMMDQLLELLSDIANSSSSEIDDLVKMLVQHSVTVAESSEELEKNNLLKSSEQVLCEHSLLKDKMKICEEKNGSSEIECEEFSSCLEKMELNLNMSILQQIVDTFVETTQPLNRFMKAAANFKDASEIPDLTNLRQKLNFHTELMCKVSNFAISCATNISCIQQIKVCCHLLKGLYEEIGIAIIASTVILNNKSLLHYINILADEWTENLKLLIKNIDDITEPIAFSQMSATKLKENFTEYLEMLKKGDTTKLEVLSSKLFSYADRMAQVILSQYCHMINSNQDNLLGYVNQLQDVLSIVKKRRKQIKINPKNLNIYQKLTKDLKLVLNLSAVIEKELLQWADLNSSDISCNFDFTKKTPGFYNGNVSKIGSFSTRSFKKKMTMSNYTITKDCSIDDISKAGSLNLTEPPISEITGLNITDILEKMENLSVGFVKEIQCSNKTDSSEISTQVSTPERLKDLEMLNQKMFRLRQLQFSNDPTKERYS